MVSNPPLFSDVAVPAVALAAMTREDAPVLANMFELYAHDFSEYVPLQLKPSGRFEIAIDERWWTGEDHAPFFIHLAGQRCGFALVRRGSQVCTDARETMDVAEFFVLRAARGRRVGTTAAHALFAMFPGAWEVRVRLVNEPANKFWTRVFESWTSGSMTTARHVSQGVEWNVFRLASAPAPR
jgi:predicted acetyltransferase